VDPGSSVRMRGEPLRLRREGGCGRISRAMCETLGRWTCDVQGGALMLVERLG